MIVNQASKTQTSIYLRRKTKCGKTRYFTHTKTKTKSKKLVSAVVKSALARLEPIRSFFSHLFSSFPSL